MTPQKRRRVRPVRKPSLPPQRRRRLKPVRSDWRGRWLKTLIIVFCVIDMVLVYFAVRQCSSPVEQAPQTEVQGREERLQVEVLNGCGVDGVADKFTRYLREKNLDVVKTDNYESYNLLRTVIIDRQGNMENAVRIAEILGLGEDRILQEIHEEYLNDATILIGKDFRQLSAWKEME
jgi:hypothetical protein